MGEMDRRDFVVGSLAAGFSAAALPISASVLTTPTDGLLAGEVRIPVGDVDLPAYWARPQSGSHWPVVVVIQEIFGVHEYIRDVCRRFAQRGAMAVSAELFARQGDPAKITDMNALMQGIVARVPDEQVLSDLDAIVQWARTTADSAAVGITGFCWGGRITWLYAAHNPQISAGVAWYGRLQGAAHSLQPRHPLDVGASLLAPVLGLYAGEDRGIPLDSVDAMRRTLQAEDASPASRRSRIDVYPEAGHGFHADYRPAYRAVDAAAAFEQCCNWFSQHGVALRTPDL